MSYQFPVSGSQDDFSFPPATGDRQLVTGRAGGK